VCEREPGAVWGGRGLGSGERPGRIGPAGREQREEEGEGADDGPGASAGDVERREGELGLGHRWVEREVEEEVGCGHVREKKRVCGPAERWEMEVC
jgi:hypothetical protein